MDDCIQTDSMINASKYKNFTLNFRKSGVLFFFMLVSISIYGEQIQFPKIAAKLTTYGLDIPQISCSSVLYKNNLLYISSNKGLLLFDGFHFSQIIGYENCKMTTIGDTIFLLGENYLSKIIADKNDIHRLHVLSKNSVQGLEQLLKQKLNNRFLSIQGQLYLSCGTVLYQVSGNILKQIKRPGFRVEEEIPDIYPSWKIQVFPKGEVQLVDQKRHLLRAVNCNFNPLQERFVAFTQDDNKQIWLLFQDKIKRLDLFEYVTLNESSFGKPDHNLPVFDSVVKQSGIKGFLQQSYITIDTMVADIYGNIWVTGHHILKSPHELFLIPNGKTQFLRIPYSDYGLLDLEKVIPLNNGFVYLYHKQLSLFFDPRKFLSETGNVCVQYTALNVDKKNLLDYAGIGDIESAKEIILDASVKMIEIGFCVDALHRDSFLCYNTFLEGYDTNWSGWNNSPSRTFACLSSGHYRFHVKARKNNGFISPEQNLNIFIKVRIWNSKLAWLIYILLIITLVYVYWLRRKISFRYEKAKLEQIINERTSELMSEKAKTDELLANLLPKDTADELKNTGKATSQKYNMVTVLFSDIQGFTKIAEEMNPEKLIDELDNFFFHFDSVVEKYNIEKIKTIGDAYMCAGGIPYKNRTNPVEVVLAALEMQDYMKQLRQKNINIWDLRIGVHTGAVIAGVVGHKRVSYDIWGDTVNTASRMESSGEPGKVNISGQTYEMVKDFFICEHRGKMPVKYKGDVDMYFVKAIRPELSIDLKVVPNKKFFIQLQLLRLQDLEEFILTKLTDELPVSLTFHNSKNTKEVYSLVELIGRAEDFSQEEILLTKTVSLFLNIGYCVSYQDHTLHSVRAAETILPKFKYEPRQIETIIQLIRNVDIRSSNPGKLESVLIDACNNYIGRVDFLVLSIHYYQEMKHYHNGLSEKECFMQQAHYLEHFHYFTATANALREVIIEEQIQRIKEYIRME